MKRINVYLSVYLVFNIIFVTMHLKNSVLPVKSILERASIDEIGYPFSLYGYWIGMDILQIQNRVYYIVFPLACICLFWGCYDYFTKREKSLQWVAIGMIGGIGGMIPQILDFMVVSCILPAVRPDSATIFFCLTPKCFLAELYYSHPMIYIIIFLLWGGCIGALMTLECYFLYKIIKRKELAICISGVMVLTSGFISEKSGCEQFCYYYLINPGQPIEGLKLSNYLLLLVLMLIITGVLYVFCKNK